MIWPFRSLRVRLLERDRELLQERLRDLEQQLRTAEERETYFRQRYERLADSVLFARREIAAPVHVEPEKASTSVGQRVMRVAGLVGSHDGVDFTQNRNRHARSAADLPVLVP